MFFADYFAINCLTVYTDSMSGWDSKSSAHNTKDDNAKKGQGSYLELYTDT